ncbi:MAG: hypothetical protein O2822_00910 [Chloroflexi bacterium]|nr:hypothetical protein [Chloroflexota bacterium]
MAIVDDRSDPTPPILVILYDDAIEPDASVAPAGEVRFTVMNRGERPHTFTLELIAEDDEPAAPPEAHPTEHRAEAVAPGDSADVLVTLAPGRYMLATTGDGAGVLADAQAELTVQPAPTYDDLEGRAGGRHT